MFSVRNIVLTSQIEMNVNKATKTWSNWKPQSRKILYLQFSFSMETTFGYKLLEIKAYKIEERRKRKKI